MGIKKNMIWIYIILLPPAGPDGKKKHDLDLYFITPSRMGKKNMIWIYKKNDLDLDFFWPRAGRGIKKNELDLDFILPRGGEG